MDYGNREITSALKCSMLPAAYAGPSAFAHEYTLACVSLPKDVNIQSEFSELYRL